MTRGVFLQGGGALGAWQAGALETLVAGGMKFDAIMGFSIGAVNGSALAFDRLPEAMTRWRELSGEALRLSPRFLPALSLCSIDPLRAFFEPARDENAAKAALKCDFTVVTSCIAEKASINARFTPLARDGWDGPLLDHAVASCAIPLVFPPVDLTYRGRPVRLVDGGVPVAPLDLSPLAGCDEIVVVEMVRAEDVGVRRWTPWHDLDQRCREAARALVDGGLAPLLRGPKPPAVRRLAPSARLEPMMLDFRKKGLAKMLAQGAADARAFLA